MDDSECKMCEIDIVPSGPVQSRFSDTFSNNWNHDRSGIFQFVLKLGLDTFGPINCSSCGLHDWSQPVKNEIGHDQSITGSIAYIFVLYMVCLV